MTPNPPIISMTSFAKFVVADAGGKLARIREISRIYDRPYAPGSDFWKGYRDGIETLHRRGGGRSGLDTIWRQAPPRSQIQFRSACDGYGRFWGSKTVEFVGTPKPAVWACDRLRVKVHPELLLAVAGKLTMVKLHTDRQLALDQRLANPLLYLVESLFPGEHRVLLLDVHRGKAWMRRTERSDYNTVLRMQAAAFIAGWDMLVAEDREAS